MKKPLLFFLALAIIPTFASGAAPRVLRVLTHSSFAASKPVIEEFEKANDAKLQFINGGDSGEVLNKAILAKGNPIADVLYGVDNTFMGRALDADILEPCDSPTLAEIPSGLKLDESRRLLPIDHGYIALNYDRKYFASRGLAIPADLKDLTLPRYRGLFVAENPATSSPGLCFLLTTIAHFGQKGGYTWEAYWSDLRKNDVLVVNGWSSAYYQEFSGTGKGKRPIVLSYATSPAAELFYASDPKPAEPPTGNILPDGATFLQVEFAGILKGAREPALARKFVDFMLSPSFQRDIPLQMWVYPASPRAELPDLFTRFAPIPQNPLSMAPRNIQAKRDEWIRRWTQIVLH